MTEWDKNMKTSVLWRVTNQDQVYEMITDVDLHKWSCVLFKSNGFKVLCCRFNILFIMTKQLYWSFYNVFHYAINRYVYMYLSWLSTGDIT